MEFVPPLTGKSLDDWEATIPARTPPALYGVPNQSFQGMDFQPAPGYQPQPQGFPLFGGLAATSNPYQSRIDTLQSRNDGLMGQMQDVRNKITGQLGQFQDLVSQPVQPFQMPPQHHVDPTSAKLGAAAAILAILGGARGQIANQAYGGFLQGQQQRADQETQRDTQQAMYDYQAAQQARQGKLQGVMAGVQKYENVLQGLGAEVNQGERQITSLVDQQERDKNRDEANRIAQQKADNTKAYQAETLAQRDRIAAMKDPVAQAKAADEAAVKASTDPQSAFYGNLDGARKFYGSRQYRDIASAENMQSMADQRRKESQARVDAIVAKTGLDKARAENLAEQTKWMPKEMADKFTLHAAQIEHWAQQIELGKAALDRGQADQYIKLLEMDKADIAMQFDANKKRAQELIDSGLNLPGDKDELKALLDENDRLKEDGQKYLDGLRQKIDEAQSRATVSSKPANDGRLGTINNPMPGGKPFKPPVPRKGK